MELAWRRVLLAERGNPGNVGEAVTALAAAVLAYWRRLGHTVSLAPDVRRYVREVTRRSAPTAAWLTNELRSAWAAESPTELHPLRRQVRFDSLPLATASGSVIRLRPTRTCVYTWVWECGHAWVHHNRGLYKTHLRLNIAASPISSSLLFFLCALLCPCSLSSQT